MGLFDDLLGGGAKQSNPTPVTPAQNVTPETIDAMLNISAGNVTSEMPSYTAQKASQTENSPVIISETPTVTESASPVIISETPATSPVIMEAPATTSPIISEVTPIAEVSTPIISEVNPVQEAVSPVISDISPVITSEISVPTENISPIISETPAISPVVEAPVISEIPGVSPVVAEAPASDVSFDIISETPADLLFATPAATETNNIFSISEEKTEAESPLFAVEAKTETPSVLDFGTTTTTSSENIFVENTLETKMEVSTSENTENFLAAGLVQLEKMEKSLAERKQKFLDQAEEYRNEKEKFAKLEEEAIANSHSMDDEQKKIDAMKKYFNKQLEGPNINDSVDTALTGIAVQNAVGNTIEKKTTRKKTTSLV